MACTAARNRRTAWFVAGFPVRFGQLGGFGHAALGYSENDLACSPAVYRGQPTDVTTSSATPAASSCLSAAVST